MKCKNCGVPNPGPGPFCMACGHRLSASPVAEDRFLSFAPPALQEVTGGSLAPSRGAGDALAQVSAAELADTSEESHPQSEIGQIGNAGTIPFSLWGPFAGRGTRGRHAAWLLNDKGAQAEELRDAVIERFARRDIPDAVVEEATLVRRGILVDSRPFFLVRRNRSTVGLYLGRFGQDVYISQVTYSKSPISAGRVLSILLLLLFIPGFTAVYNHAAASVPQAVGFLGLQLPDLRNLVGLTCCLGPFYLLAYLALGLLALFSLYKWLTDRDILAALRESPNEFDIDDTASLEKAVEQTVREALDSLGLESRVLMPPAADRPVIRLI
jgi:hypothetical protein